MTIERHYKNSKTQSYAILDDKSNLIARFDDLVTAAIALRYMLGGNMSLDERQKALAALTSKSGK